MVEHEADIFSVIARGDLELVREMVTADASVAASRNEQGVSALMTAAYRGQTEMVKLLAQAQPQLDINEATAVGDLEQVRRCIADTGAIEAYSADGFTPLQLAAFFGQFQAASLLVDAGADVNSVSHNPMRIRPIHAAAVSGRLDTMRLLLERGVDVNATQEGGFTALHEAAHTGKSDLIELLLEFGADCTVRTHDGKTAAELAESPDPRLTP